MWGTGGSESLFYLKQKKLCLLDKIFYMSWSLEEAGIFCFKLKLVLVPKDQSTGYTHYWVIIRFLKTFVPFSSTATGTLTSLIILPRTFPRETSGARPASASWRGKCWYHIRIHGGGGMFHTKIPMFIFMEISNFYRIPYFPESFGLPFNFEDFLVLYKRQ
jgi:hypothetical protein